MRSRVLLASAFVAVLLGGPAVASGTGPVGSTEDGGNTVTCNSYPNAPDRVDVESRPEGVAVHGNTGSTYAGTNGVEACGDNGGSWRGRAYADGGGVTYDGATWNSDPSSADNGCVSVGPGGANTAC